MLLYPRLYEFYHDARLKTSVLYFLKPLKMNIIKILPHLSIIPALFLYSWMLTIILKLFRHNVRKPSFKASSQLRSRSGCQSGCNILIHCDTFYMSHIFDDVGCTFTQLHCKFSQLITKIYGLNFREEKFFGW